MVLLYCGLLFQSCLQIIRFLLNTVKIYNSFCWVILRKTILFIHSLLQIILSFIIGICFLLVINNNSSTVPMLLIFNLLVTRNKTHCWTFQNGRRLPKTMWNFDHGILQQCLTKGNVLRHILLRHTLRHIYCCKVP